MAERCFDAYSCVAPELGARIAELERELRISVLVLEGLTHVCDSEDECITCDFLSRARKLVLDAD